MDPQTLANAPVKKDKSKLLTIIFLIIAVLLLVGLIAIYFSANNKSKQQAATIAQQQTKITDQQAEIEKLKAGIDNTKIVITEMGLQYPKSTDNNNIVFIIDQKDKTHPNLYLTSKYLMEAQLTASRLVPPPQKNACGAAEGAAGTITYYKADDTLNGQKVTAIQSADLRKIGDNYYYYQKAPAVCSFDKNVQNEQTKATTQAQNFFKSLELKKEN